MKEFSQISYLSTLFGGWSLVGIILLCVLATSTIIYNCKVYYANQLDPFPKKATTFLVIGYMLSIISIIMVLASTQFKVNNERHEIKSELISERYELSFIDDKKIEKLSSDLYRGEADVYSAIDKKLYTFSYIFDDEGIFLQQPSSNSEGKDKSPDEFLKDKTIINGR